MAKRWRLSRFAYVHREADTLIAASARSDARVPLIDPSSVAVVAALAQPATVEELARAVDVRTGPIAALVEQLAAAGLIDAADADGDFREDRDPSLRQWEFHDRLFRARERTTGRPLAPFQESPSSPDDVPLFAPDVEALAATDLPFTAVLESRRSIRRFGEPISLRQLGEFLWRVSRSGTNGLTLYLSVDRCAGLEAGLFRYRAGTHVLTRLSDRTADVDEMLENGRRAGIVDRPQVLFTMTASRENAASYGAFLIQAGTLYQTMYLAATAMGLAPCGIGLGDAGLFARAAGVDPFAGPSVGEFALGTISRDRPALEEAAPTAPT